MSAGNYLVSGKIVCGFLGKTNFSAFTWCGLCSSKTPNFVLGGSVVNNFKQKQYITFYKYNSITTSYTPTTINFCYKAQLNFSSVSTYYLNLSIENSTGSFINIQDNIGSYVGYATTTLKFTRIG